MINLEGAMINKTSTLMTVSAGLMALATSASAAIIDFTDLATGTSGDVLGVSWNLTSSGVLNNAQGYDGALPTPPADWELALDRDGYGVGDDEISYIDTSEWVKITFDSWVKVSAVAFLDLFLGTSTQEVAYATDNYGTITQVDSTFAPFLGGGFAEADVDSVWIKSLVFTVADGNDPYGNADGALAGIEVAAVPIPAAGFMLLGALGGLTAIRRRKKA